MEIYRGTDNGISAVLMRLLEELWVGEGPKNRKFHVGVKFIIKEGVGFGVEEIY